MTNNHKTQGTETLHSPRAQCSDARSTYVPPSVTSFSDDDIWRVLGPAKTGSLDGVNDPANLIPPIPGS